MERRLRRMRIRRRLALHLWAVCVGVGVLMMAHRQVAGPERWWLGVVAVVVAVLLVVVAVLLVVVVTLVLLLLLLRCRLHRRLHVVAVWRSRR
jgi:heme/copper-type cytochrome/quinol oxidase subunit 2